MILYSLTSSMGNWFRTIALTVLGLISIEAAGQKLLSLEEARNTALENSIQIKNAEFNSQYIQQDITGSKKKIFYPSGSGEYSVNKDIQQIVAISAGFDWQFGRVATVKYHKNRLASHEVNTTFVEASVLRDISIVYFRARTDYEMIEMYQQRLSEIDSLIAQTKDSTMREANTQTFLTYKETINTKIKQHQFSYETNIEDLYSRMNIDRPEEKVIVMTEFPVTITIEGLDTFIYNLKENAVILHSENIDRDVENKELEKKIAWGNALPSIGTGYRWFYDDFTQASDNSVYVKITIPILNKGVTGTAINKANIGIEQIYANAEYQRREIGVTVTKEVNNWQEQVSAMPSEQALNNAWSVYIQFRDQATTITTVDYMHAMTISKNLAEAMLDYYSLVENMFTYQLKAYEEEMKLRQTHKDFTSPIYEVGQYWNSNR